MKDEILRHLRILSIIVAAVVAAPAAATGPVDNALTAPAAADTPAQDVSPAPKPPDADRQALSPTPSTTTNSASRYQALALPRNPGSAGDKMMILDTLTGDVWQWFDSPALSQYLGRTGLTYMGKLKPGSAPGETITFKRFDAGHVSDGK